jgi:hypothetical protein
MPTPLHDIYLFSDGRPALMIPVCAMPYLLDDAYLIGYAHLLNDAWLLGDAHPA